MAKIAGRPRISTDSEGTSTVRIERRLHDMAKKIAAFKGRDVGRVLSDILTAPLERAYREVLRDEED